MSADGQRSVAALARRALGAAAEDDRLHPVQDARQLHLHEHAVDPVGRFLDVLHEQDRVGEVGQQPRADDRRQHREVAADEAAARPPGRDGADAVLHRHQLIAGRQRVGHRHRLALHQHAPEPVDVEPVPFGRAVHAVKGDEAALGIQRQQQRGDVAVAEQDLRVARDARRSRGAAAGARSPSRRAARAPPPRQGR